MFERLIRAKIEGVKSEAVKAEIASGPQGPFVSFSCINISPKPSSSLLSTEFPRASVIQEYFISSL